MTWQGQRARIGRHRRAVLMIETTNPKSVQARLRESMRVSGDIARNRANYEARLLGEPVNFIDHLPATRRPSETVFTMLSDIGRLI
jgi:hypothetical protein